MKKVIALILTLVIVLSLAACGSKTGEQDSNAATSGESADPIRVAGILSGPITDMSWNQTAYQGLMKIEAMGAEVTYQENVANSDLPDCINTYANDGYDLIILSTNSYEEAALPIIKDYPDTHFIIISGQTTENNVTSYQIADEDQGFMQGVICAALSKTGKVGFIGAAEITPILNGRAGFMQGAKYINDAVEVNAVMTGDWTDVAAAKETAKAMINTGVDAIGPMCDNASLGVDEAAQELGAYIAAPGEGQDTIAPDAVVCAVIKDTSIIYERAFQDYLDGKLDGTTGIVRLSAKDGVVYLSDWYPAADGISDEIKTQITDIYHALASGDITIEVD